MNGQQFEMGVIAVRAFAVRAKRVASEVLAPVGDAFEAEYYRILLENLSEAIGETSISLYRSQDAQEKLELDAKFKKMILRRNQINFLLLEISSRAANRQSKRQARED